MKPNKEKGITLIALVITIIVLLILAGVAIATLTGDNGVLTKAVSAKEKTETARETEEKKLELLEKQLNGEGIITVSDLQVGDYVKYGDKLTSQSYVTKQNGEPDTGYETSQTFNTNTTTLWRVINKKANGNVEIVAVNNTLSNDGTTGLYLKGQNGFLNAETVLNNLCSKLYANPTYGTARSIDVADINSLTEFRPETDATNYNKPYTYTSGGPFWSKDTNTFRTATTDKPVIVEYTDYYYTVNEDMQLYDTLMEESKTYTGDYSEDNYPMFYWLASRGVYAGNAASYFNVRYVASGCVRGCGLFYANTNGSPNEYLRACAVRPIVNLNSSVQIDTSDATKDGSEQGKAWILK